MASLRLPCLAAFSTLFLSMVSISAKADGMTWAPTPASVIPEAAIAAHGEMPAAQVFSAAKSVRVGATPLLHVASKRAVPGFKETYEVLSPYKWSHEKGALNCYFGAPASLSRAEAGFLLVGPNGQPLNQLSWRRTGDGTTYPSYVWVHEVFLNPKAKLIPSPDQLSWRNSHRDCLKENSVVDAEGDRVWRCEVWGEPRSYTLNVSLRMRLDGAGNDVYSVTCAMETNDASRFITWDEVSSYMKDTLTIEF